MRGYIRYSSSAQQQFLPLIATAGVLDAIPLEPTDPRAANLTLRFDALAEFANATAHDATAAVFDRFANMTTGLAKLNPGYDVHGHPLRPPLTRTPNLKLVDYVVSRRLFALWLNNGCLPLTAEHKLFRRIVADAPWPKPIAVYGYDDTFPFGGDLFEAETTCVPEHSLGQVASLVGGLSWWSNAEPPVTTPLPQPPPPPPVVFNASKTYVALIVGDGDNIGFVKSTRRDWMEQRVARCEAKACYPLLWSLSPHTAYLAPAWFRWYFAQAARTGRDWFVLPPSGHLYAYPSLMSDADQAAFVAATEADCELLSTSAVVAWEFAGTWEAAIRAYFPRYAARGVVQALFATNVPYMLPVLAFGAHEYKLLGPNKTVALFKPHEWRGPQQRSAQEMASMVNGWAAGTIAAIYTTSDGGLDLSLLDEMVAMLGDHVEIVTHEQLAALARAAGSNYE